MVHVSMVSTRVRMELTGGSRPRAEAQGDCFTMSMSGVA
jgi:hypothetical protein